MLREILYTRKLAVTISTKYPQAIVVQHAANPTWAGALSNATWLMTLLAHQSRKLVK